MAEGISWRFSFIKSLINCRRGRCGVGIAGNSLAGGDVSCFSWRYETFLAAGAGAGPALPP